MVRARIKNGQVEAEDPIPAEWEGRTVKITALTPDDEPEVDLEDWLAKLHAMGPMEFDPGEREMIQRALAEMDQISKAAMKKLMDDSQ